MLPTARFRIDSAAPLKKNVKSKTTLADAVSTKANNQLEGIEDKTDQKMVEVKSIFSRPRYWLSNQILKCDIILSKFEYDDFTKALAEAYDANGNMVFPLNIPNRDATFHFWNLAAGTLPIKGRNLVSSDDIEAMLREIKHLKDSQSILENKLKSASSKMKNSGNLAYDFAKDKIVVKW